MYKFTCRCFWLISMILVILQSSLTDNMFTHLCTVAVYRPIGYLLITWLLVVTMYSPVYCVQTYWLPVDHLRCTHSHRQVVDTATRLHLSCQWKDSIFLRLILVVDHRVWQVTMVVLTTDMFQAHTGESFSLHTLLLSVFFSHMFNCSYTFSLVY